jgi:HK97 family phage prohead protease
MQYRYFPSVRKLAPTETNQEPVEPGMLSFVASTDNPDRYGDVIDQKGWNLAAYKANPVVLYQHDHNSLPIGRGAVRMAPEGLVIDIEFDKADPRAAEIAGKAERGFLNAVSVGFSPLKAISRANLPVEHYAFSEDGGSFYEKAELLEVSIVTIPANPDATAIAAKSLDNETKNFIREHIESYIHALNSVKLRAITKQNTVEVPAPDGFHWMDYENGPVLMEGDAADHDGALAVFAFEVIEEADPDMLKQKEADKDEEKDEYKEAEEDEDEKMPEKSFGNNPIERDALITALLQIQELK